MPQTSRAVVNAMAPRGELKSSILRGFRACRERPFLSYETAGAMNEPDAAGTALRQGMGEGVQSVILTAVMSLSYDPLQGGQ